MNPEDILRPCDYEYYRPIPPPPGGFPGYEKLRSPQQLQLDLNVAHDRIKQQVRVNDKLLFSMQRMEKELAQERKWRKLLTTALGLSWASWISAVWWLSKVISPLIIKGINH